MHLPAVEKSSIGLRILVGVALFLTVMVLARIQRRAAGGLIPAFSVESISGKTIQSKDLTGQNIFVQFINASTESDTRLFRKVCANWGNKSILILGIISASGNLKEEPGLSRQNIFLTTRYEYMSRRFGIRNGQGSYFIYDKGGRLIKNGDSLFGYEDGPKIFLKQLVEKRFFKIGEFIPERASLRDIDWLKEIASDLEPRNKASYLVALFTSICESCPSGKIVRFLETYHKKAANTSYVLCVLSSDYSKEDILALQSQLGLTIPIVLAGTSLASKWKSLALEFRDIDVSNIVFLVDSSMHITRTYDPSCNCIEQLLRKLE